MSKPIEEYEDAKEWYGVQLSDGTVQGMDKPWRTDYLDSAEDALDEMMTGIKAANVPEEFYPKIVRLREVTHWEVVEDAEDGA